MANWVAEKFFFSSLLYILIENLNLSLYLNKNLTRNFNLETQKEVKKLYFSVTC